MRTVFRDTLNSRQICLIGFFRTKYASLIFAIVSTTNIPKLLPQSFEEASETKYQGGHFWTPITPIQGSNLHAGS
ncbi:hypothetical protein QO034_23190, partial [Sedimentitalea sp. JM2-8]